MITVYLKEKQLKPHKVSKRNAALIEKALWIDLIDLKDPEKLLIEETLNLEIPRKEEMESIEPSYRLYQKEGIMFMTASIVADSSTDPHQEAVTFILAKNKLITLRYFESHAFNLFIEHINIFHLQHNTSTVLLITLLDTIIKRFADNLEQVGKNLDDESRKIFGQGYLTKKAKGINYQNVVRHLGRQADLNNKVRDCLMTFNRLLSFYSQTADKTLDDKKKIKINAIKYDIDALNDYSNFLSNKVYFFLDATLGFINIEQSMIIKIFSVAAVIFLPPTLIASIYGMNFKWMPELSWKWGYLLAILLMLLSAFIPYKFFKYKKWL